jgi:hypothetical protein
MKINIGGRNKIIVAVNKNKVKRNCFICGKKIEPTEDKYLKKAEARYIEKGNCCSKCNARAEKNLKELKAEIINQN